MIVKNEGRIIERSLQSVLPVIDMYCICDTGSTDDTVSKIDNFMKTHGIPGFVVHNPFINFCENRNFALQKACELQPDYVLLMDADMILKIEPSFDKEKLTACSYKLKQINASLTYFNVRLVQPLPCCRYSGVTHEYINVPSSEIIDTIYIDDIGDGGSKANKIERDIQLLDQGIKDDPSNSRYYFYLANSYLDCGMYAKAVDTYQKRISMEGWSEEVYYSYFKMGMAYKALHNYKDMVATFLSGWNFRPTRIETLYQLVVYYKDTKQYKLAHLFYQLAKSIPYPTDVLFVHKDIYDYKLDYEFSLYAFYAGIKSVPYQTLMNTPYLDLYSQFGNYKFYCPKPEPSQVYDMYTTCKIHHKNTEFDMFSSTPSMVLIDTHIVVNVRMVSYRINPSGGYDYPGVILTRNRKVILDKDFVVLESKLLDQEYDGGAIKGLEDVKLFYYNNRIYFTCTCLPDKAARVGYGEYETDVFTVFKTDKQHEKNWVFIPNSLKMIYKWKPLEIGAIVGDELKIEEAHDMPKMFEMARGSTNGVEFQDEYWFVVHFVHLHPNEPRFYYHALVRFDKNMMLTSYTMPFKLSNCPIEYCEGIIVTDSEVILSYSENDSASKIAKYPKDEFKYICNC
jgi:tetratricopeptide (TPR) repeat protein